MALRELEDAIRQLQLRLGEQQILIGEQQAQLQLSDPVGRIEGYAGSTPPAGWLLCDGSAVSRATYAQLFAAIGTTYGAGNGSTTFNLPDLRGRVAVGRDTGQTEFDSLGESGGAKTVSHSHGSTGLSALVNLTYTSGSLFIDYARRIAASYTENRRRFITGSGGTSDSHSETNTDGIAIGGSTDSASPSVLQPYLVVNAIIRAA